MENKKRDYNLAAKILLGLSILQLAIQAISYTLNYFVYPKYGIYSLSYYHLLQIGISLLLILFAFFTLKRKSFGLIAFLTLALIRMFGIYPHDSEIAYSYFLGGNFVVFMRDAGLFAIALCFKKNGISGWRSFFASDEYIDSHYIDKTIDNGTEKDVKIDSNDIIDNNVLEDKQKITNEDVINTQIDIKESVSESTDILNNPVKRKNNGVGIRNRRKILSLIIAVAAFLLLITPFVLVVFHEYPRNITKYADKFKFYYHLPNNKLAERMFDNYLKAKDSDLDNLSIDYLETAYIANPSNRPLLDSIAFSYFRLGRDTKDSNDTIFYGRTLNLCNQILKKTPHDIAIRSLYIKSLYNKGDRKTAYNEAEVLLMDSPQNALALDLLCRKNYNDKNWEKLEKLAKKGYELDCETDYKADFAYLYAKALYEKGFEYDARIKYKEAIQIDNEHWLREKFTKIGGTPCIVKSIKVQNITYDNKIINSAGSTIYDDKTQYLSPIVELKPLRSGYFIFDIKLFYNGNLSTGKNSPEGYSYQHRATLVCDDDSDDLLYMDSSFDILTEAKTSKQKFGSWGSDSPGHWDDGAYRIEIWWEGEKLYSYSFNIYSGYWHNFGYGNRFD